MNLLILGGTQFVGRAIVQAALDAGHTVTLFHRGQTNPDLFPEAEHILSDRDGGLNALGDRTWDTAIDISGYVPRLVKDSAEYLADRVQRYIFISTISVYAESDTTGRDENAPLATLDDPTTEEVTGETYGGLKVLCEQAAETALPGRVLTIRPGLIVGPNDHTNRFTYWPVRIRDGGKVLAPGGADTPTQFIDVRDLSQWMIRLTEQQTTGIFNATGPNYRLTFGKLFETCKQVSGSDAEFVWVEDAFLLENEVAPFTDLPFWLPRPVVDRLMSINVQQAIDAGLTFRPLEDTIRATLAYVDQFPTGELPGRPAGMSREREATLVEKHLAQAAQ